jgi:hypothetical protein
LWLVLPELSKQLHCFSSSSGHYQFTVRVIFMNPVKMNSYKTFSLINLTPKLHDIYQFKIHRIINKMVEIKHSNFQKLSWCILPWVLMHTPIIHYCIKLQKNNHKYYHLQSKKHESNGDRISY